MSNSVSFKPPTRVIGAVFGVFRNGDDDVKMTADTKLCDDAVCGKLSYLIKMFPLVGDIKLRVFYDIHADYNIICVVDIGPEDAGYNPVDAVDEKKENIRKGVAAAVRQLIDCGATEIRVDTCHDEESVAEAVYLQMFRYDELKSEASRKPKVKVERISQSSEKTFGPWEIGTLKADSQNFARYLTETPANYMEPSHFVEKVKEKLKNLDVTVIVRNKKWAEDKGMGAFISVSNGSRVPPLLLELHYNASGEAKPVVLVGKGITFDSGGTSLKPSLNMDKMRGDMGGAAVVASTLYAVASLGLKLNVIGIIPLTENMPGGAATKPGDVVFAMNKKSIQIDNTDAEGRLVLADGLCYAQTFSPSLVMDVATLTGAMKIALGRAAAGVYTNESLFFEELQKASYVTGDRIWKMPLLNYFSNNVKKCDLADLNNKGKGFGASCFAAAFLREFVNDLPWIHLDTSGVNINDDNDVPYLQKGMSGRPTRTLIEFFRNIASNKDDQNEVSV